MFKVAQDFKSNKLQLSLLKLQQISSINPHSIDALINISTVKMVQGNIQQALTTLNKAVQIDSFDYRIYYNLFVIYWRTGNQKEALRNFRKCLSLIYALNKKQAERALQLWSGNVVAHVIKIINLINEDQIDDANRAISRALQQCSAKNDILEIVKILDNRLSKQAEKQSTAKDYNNLLLSASATEITNDEQFVFNMYQLNDLIEEFNKINQSSDSKNQFIRYEQQPEIIFMKTKEKTTINIQQYINKNLGSVELQEIKQQNNLEGEDNNEDKNNNQPLLANNGVSEEPVKKIQQGQTNIEKLQVQQQQHEEILPVKAVIKEQEKKENNQAEKHVENQEQKAQNKEQQANPPKHQQKTELLYPVTHPNFEVKLVMADLLISQQLIGKMDPYVYYQYGGQKHKSTIAKGGGTKPRWKNEIKIFSLERNPTIMKISIYDREIFKWDDLVGTGQFEVIKEGLHTLPIYLKQKQTGTVVFYITKKE